MTRQDAIRMVAQAFAESTKNGEDFNNRRMDLARARADVQHA